MSIKIGQVTLSRATAWSDAELLAHMAAELLDDVAYRLHRLGGWCHRRSTAAHDRERTRA